MRTANTLGQCSRCGSPVASARSVLIATTNDPRARDKRLERVATVGAAAATMAVLGAVMASVGTFVSLFAMPW